MTTPHATSEHCVFAVTTPHATSEHSSWRVLIIIVIIIRMQIKSVVQYDEENVMLVVEKGFNQQKASTTNKKLV